MHVEAAVSLNLQRKDVFSGLAVVKSNKTSGIRAVKLYPVAIFFKALRQTGREFGRTAFIEQGTETEVNRLAFVHDSADLGRHGMAVHQQAKAEFFIAAVNQLFEPFMVNVVNIFNPFLDFIIRNQPGIDIFGLATARWITPNPTRAAAAADSGLRRRMIEIHTVVNFDFYRG